MSAKNNLKILFALVLIFNAANFHLDVSLDLHDTVKINIIINDSLNNLDLKFFF